VSFPNANLRPSVFFRFSRLPFSHPLFSYPSQFFPLNSECPLPPMDARSAPDRDSAAMPEILAFKDAKYPFFCCAARHALDFRRRHFPPFPRLPRLRNDPSDKHQRVAGCLPASCPPFLPFSLSSLTKSQRHTDGPSQARPRRVASTVTPSESKLVL